MPIPSTETRNYDAVLSTTLANVRGVLEDQIATSTSFLFYLMRRQDGGYRGLPSLGERAEVPLMYAIGNAQVYSGYDVLDVTPMDGITKAFYPWRQMAVPISISRIEERQNSGEFQMINLLRGKTQQALLGIQDLFTRALYQGNGPNSATAITTAYTDTVTGALFVDPLPLQVAYDPTTSTSIGNINQNTYSWWRNQLLNSTSTTYAGFKKDLRRLYNLCSKGPGGGPNLHVCDQYAYELYEAALAVDNRYPSYQRADIPFDNIGFRGQPVTWDEYIPDVQNGTITGIPVTTAGTWWMLNTKFWEIQYDEETNWITTPFTKPENQDAKTAHIMWYGAACVKNRRKQGVMGGIDTTIAS